jgi:hypothetical protein
MEGFSFVTTVTGLSRPNTGKEDDDDDVSYPYLFSNLVYFMIGFISRSTD